MSDWDAIVIGSGAGGLTAAVALANLGQKVLVLEQHYLPGGWTHTFALNGFRFSPGVHYVGQLQDGGGLRKILEGLGLASAIEFNELNPDGFDHIVFNDEVFDIPKGRHRFQQRLIERFPEERSGIERYFRLMERVDRGLSKAAGISGLWDKIKLLLTAPAIVVYGLRPAGAVIDRFVKDQKLKAILEARAGDHGMAPGRVPFALHVAIEAHYWHGAWYPKGGGGAIPRAFLSRLKQQGGELRVRTRVEQILVKTTESGKQAVGVRLSDGTELKSDVVISNADAWATYQNLLPREDVSEQMASRVGKLEPSISALSLFLATDLDLEALNLDSGNYWILNDERVDQTYRLTPEDLASDGPFPGSFLTVTTKKDPSKRKNGIHTMEAFTFVPAAAFQAWQESQMGERPVDYKRFKQHLQERMLDSIERVVPGIRDHLVLCELGTPLTNSFYVEAFAGNIYGTAKSRQQIGSQSLPITTEINGLYHCGQSTAAHGILGVMATGIMAAEAITGLKSDQLLSHADGQSVQLNAVE